MASKIDNQVPIAGAAGPPATRVAARGSSDPGKAPAAPTATDRLQLSGEASGLISAQREIASAEPNLDQVKIDALRAAIANGTYQINPQEIASRLLALERKLA